MSEIYLIILGLGIIAILLFLMIGIIGVSGREISQAISSHKEQLALCSRRYESISEEIRNLSLCIRRGHEDDDHINLRSFENRYNNRHPDFWTKTPLEFLIQRVRLLCNIIPDEQLTEEGKLQKKVLIESETSLGAITLGSQYKTSIEFSYDLLDKLRDISKSPDTIINEELNDYLIFLSTR